MSNGFSDEWGIYLCSSGVAHWSSSSSAMSTGGGGTLTYAGQDEGQGTWGVQGSNLVVQWSDGSSTNLPLAWSGGRVKVNQSNTWVQDQQYCP